MSFAPARFDLVDSTDDITSRYAIPVGATYSVRFQLYDLNTVGAVLTPEIDYDTLDPLDLSSLVGSGITLKSFLKLGQYAADHVAEATASIVGDGTPGQIDLEIDSESSAALQTYRSGYFDIESNDVNFDPPVVERLIYGVWKTIPEITR